jgi:hypothetical protein
VRGYWSDTLQCNWLRWSPIDGDMLRLDLPKNNCTDMTGCIKTALAIMPGVMVIEVFEDERPDVRYERMPSGKWQAFMRRGYRPDVMGL